MPKTRVKQKQSQKQTVIVRLDGVAKAKRSKRKRRVPKKQAEQVSIQSQTLPPNVIYQSSYNIPYPVFKAPPTPQETTPFLQDVGQVGTEGRVEILSKPTRQETLKELTAPVPAPINRAKDFMAQQEEAPNQMTTFLTTEQIDKELERNWKDIQNLYNSVTPSKQIITTDKSASKIPIPRRNKKEMSETRNMINEDVASYGLRLSQFNNPPIPQIQENIPEPTTKVFKPYPVEKELLTESMVSEPKPKQKPKIVIEDDEMSQITQSEIAPQPEVKPKGKGSWEYWINRYEYLTDTPFDRKTTKLSLAEFKKMVQRMEQ